MFKGELSGSIRPIIPRLKGDLFEKDETFNNNALLSKGIHKETITENGDIIELVQTFVSLDKSFRKQEILTMDRSSFVSIVTDDIITLKDAKKEMNLLSIKLKELSDKSLFEECIIVRDKIQILKCLIKTKK